MRNFHGEGMLRRNKIAGAGAALTLEPTRSRVAKAVQDGSRRETESNIDVLVSGPCRAGAILAARRRIFADGATKGDDRHRRRRCFRSPSSASSADIPISPARRETRDIMAFRHNSNRIFGAVAPDARPPDRATAELDVGGPAIEGSPHPASASSDNCCLADSPMTSVSRVG